MINMKIAIIEQINGFTIVYNYFGVEIAKMKEPVIVYAYNTEYIALGSSTDLANLNDEVEIRKFDFSIVKKIKIKHIYQIMDATTIHFPIYMNRKLENRGQSFLKNSILELNIPHLGEKFILKITEKQNVNYTSFNFNSKHSLEEMVICSIKRFLRKNSNSLQTYEFEKIKSLEIIACLRQD